MDWTENKILLEYSKYTPCQEIFQAVCDEIGRHYEEKGGKYTRSRQKVTFTDNKLKVEICFWSSRNNIPGENVNLEILPNFYSTEIIKSEKSNGFLFGHTALFIHKYMNNPKQIKIRQIFGDVLELVEEHSNESVIKHNHHCNIYGLDENKFKLIIKFIDENIMNWISKIKTEKGILELTENACITRIWSLNGKGGNSDFIKYVKLHFPNIDIEKLLGNEATNA